MLIARYNNHGMAAKAMPPTCITTLLTSLKKLFKTNTTRLVTGHVSKSEMFGIQTCLLNNNFIVKAGLNHLTIPLIRTGRTVSSRSISSHFSSYSKEVQL